MQKSTLIEHQAVAHRYVNIVLCMSILIVMFRPQHIAQAPQPPTTVSEPQPVNESDKVKSEEKEEEDEIPQLIVKSVETVKKPNVIKKLADDWDDEDEVKAEEGEEKGDNVPDIDNVKVKETSRKSVDKSDDVDEDQIVADVDDILKETDNIMSDVDTMLSNKKKSQEVTETAVTSKRSIDDEEGGVIKSLVDKKRPTAQCEECYECFEDQEKLAWHALNDH